VTARDENLENETLLRVVEQVGLLLSEVGMPRMPARVFAYVLVEDADRYTARELADGLRVSPAAISGAVRYLVQAGLLDKGREPESRSDHYRIYDDDVWSAIMAQRLPLLERWAAMLADAVDQLPDGSRGRHRLRETEAYYRFAATVSVTMMEQWRAQRDELIARLDAGTPDRANGQRSPGPAVAS
jgi:DNA-binding transcriptional regulator GbsR (MarR family)